ncbi:MAG: cytochrome c peroxidase [Planctomycetota bacterium]
MTRTLRRGALAATLLLTASLAAQTTLTPLGPMPAPPENPTTPAKAVLGKMLFWEEQLSSDNGVACGTCHKPFAGGSDDRVHHPFAGHPGPDALFGTDDDIAGSIGVISNDVNCNPLDDGTFFPMRQVTARRTPSFIGIGYGDTSFWDGRASDTFEDPQNPGTVLIPTGGALESQAVGPILSAVEMACEDRTWADVVFKLETVTPMALATDLTPDMVSALSADPTYPQLFEEAFGDTAVTAARIGMAIASYERTLVPNRTPLDLFLLGDSSALTADQEEGLALFEEHCSVCHAGNEFSDHDFHHIGVRPDFEDIGREEVTGLIGDRGKMKTPPLRNVALRAPFFHNGGKATLQDVLIFYNVGGDFPTTDPDMIELGIENQDLLLIEDFLTNALTDDRVLNEVAPFDRPTLQQYFVRGDSNQDLAFDIGDALHLLDLLFASTGNPIPCADASDANDDGALDLGDAITMLNRLFAGASELPAPTDVSFGHDPTIDALGCNP